jgi:hypothetical protein
MDALTIISHSQTGWKSSLSHSRFSVPRSSKAWGRVHSLARVLLNKVVVSGFDVRSGSERDPRKMIQTIKARNRRRLLPTMLLNHHRLHHIMALNHRQLGLTMANHLSPRPIMLHNPRLRLIMLHSHRRPLRIMAYSHHRLRHIMNTFAQAATQAATLQT